MTKVINVPSQYSSMLICVFRRVYFSWVRHLLKSTVSARTSVLSYQNDNLSEDAGIMIAHLYLEQNLLRSGVCLVCQGGGYIVFDALPLNISPRFLLSPSPHYKLSS